MSFYSNPFTPFLLLQLPTSVIATAIISFFCHIIGYFLCFPICTAIFKSYSGLSKRDQVEWNSRVISNIHAYVMLFVGMYIYFTTPEYYRDLNMLHGDVQSATLFAYSFGYFCFDLILLFRYMRDDSASFIHHFVIITADLMCFVCIFLYFFHFSYTY